jgi:hypothetical protein
MAKQRIELFVAIYAAVLATGVAAFQVWQELSKHPRLTIVSATGGSIIKPAALRNSFQFRHGLTVANMGSKPLSVLSIDDEEAEILDFRCANLPLTIAESEAKSFDCDFMIIALEPFKLDAQHYVAKVKYIVNTTIGRFKYDYLVDLFTSFPETFSGDGPDDRNHKLRKRN